ncbi:MAG: hypothetical protein ACKOKG_03010 [Verrucomicrobiota bacterium]
MEIPLGRRHRFPLQGTLQRKQMDALATQLLLEFRPPLGNGPGIAPFHGGTNLDGPLATPKFDAKLGARIRTEHGGHGTRAKALQEDHLARKEFLKPGGGLRERKFGTRGEGHRWRGFARGRNLGLPSQ